MILFPQEPKIKLELTATEKKFLLRKERRLHPDYVRIVVRTPHLKPVQMTFDELDDFYGYICEELEDIELCLQDKTARQQKAEKLLTSICKKTAKLLDQFSQSSCPAEGTELGFGEIPDSVLEDNDQALAQYLATDEGQQVATMTFAEAVATLSIGERLEAIVIKTAKNMIKVLEQKESLDSPAPPLPPLWKRYAETFPTAEALKEDAQLLLQGSSTLTFQEVLDQLLFWIDKALHGGNTVCGDARVALAALTFTYAQNHPEAFSENILAGLSEKDKILGVLIFGGEDDDEDDDFMPPTTPYELDAMFSEMFESAMNDTLTQSKKGGKKKRRGRKGAAKPDPDRLYQFKISLKGIRPPIWRRIQVKDCSMLQFHQHIQDAMGWTNTHLYAFEIEGIAYGDTEYLDDADDASKFRLSDIIPEDGEKYKFFYEYDFGDSWNHIIQFEKFVEPEKGKTYPCCIKGKRACPPEDIGGPWGYAEYAEEVDDDELEYFDPKETTADMQYS